MRCTWAIAPYFDACGAAETVVHLNADDHLVDFGIARDSFGDTVQLIIHEEGGHKMRPEWFIDRIRQLES